MCIRDRFLVCHVSGVADDRSHPENPLRQCGCQLDILHFVHVAVILFHLDQSLIDGNHCLLYTSRAICHELDHLDGHMYTEKVEGPLHEVTYESDEEE